MTVGTNAAPTAPTLSNYTVGRADGSTVSVTGVALFREESGSLVFYDTVDASDAPLATFSLTGAQAVTTITTAAPTPVPTVDVLNAGQAIVGPRQPAVVADMVDTSSLRVQGRDFVAYLNDRPLGLLSQGFETTLNLQGYTAEKGIAEIGFLAQPGRGYRISVDGPEYGSSDSSTVVNFKMRAVAGGTAPTVSSSIIRDFDGEVAQSPTGRIFRGNFLWYPNVSVLNRPMRLLLTFTRAVGSGTVGINCVNNRLQMWVEDIGPALPNSIVINGSQAASPPPAPAAAPVAHTDTFYATWSASYRSNGTRWAEGAQCYQGYGDSYNGNQASMIGFDVATIRSKLVSGSIQSATFYAQNQHTWVNGSGYTLLGSHGNDTMPATFSGPNIVERRSTTTVTEGAWCAVDVTGLFQEIVAGTTSGILLGHGPDNSNGWYSVFTGSNGGTTNGPRIVVNWNG